jgi:hypothetical protein
MGLPLHHLDVEMASLYARAVLAVARANDTLSREEGQRLQELVSTRTGIELSLDELLLHEPLLPSELAAQAARQLASPFRGAAITRAELARLIIVDSLAVVLAKGYVAETEVRELLRFTSALECTTNEVRALAADAARHLDAHLG